jgi:DNA-binding transcriptional regulator YhcF (GntR family)
VTTRREGVPPFVDVYNRVLALTEKEGLALGDEIPSEVALMEALRVERRTLHEALLLLEEDGYLARDPQRHWVLAQRSTHSAGFVDSFHRLLGPEVRPVNRLHAAIEPKSAFTKSLLGGDGSCLIWETVFAIDGVRLAATLEFLRLDRVPDGVDTSAPADQHDVVAQPTLLEALGADYRARLEPRVWRLVPVSKFTERLSWMDLPMHAIPAALTVVLAEDGAPVYAAKNIFDLGSFSVTVDRLGGSW